MPKRITKRAREALKVAKRVAARLERANQPERIIPTAGAIRFDYDANTFQVYIHGEWVDAQKLQGQQP